MRRRIYTALAAPAILLLASARQARGEVYAEVGPEGRFVAAHVALPRAHPDRVWDPTGSAESSSYVLNPNGSLRGDGRPDIAVNPVAGFPRAVWARRVEHQYDIVTSTFIDGEWTPIITVNRANDVDDVDPRLSYRSDGVAVITWWVKGSNPTVQMAYSMLDGTFTDAGTISPAGIKARKPVARHADNLTIIAWQTPEGIDLRTFIFGSSSPAFGDGPTPFPRSDDPPPGNDPGTDDPGMRDSAPPTP